jgi:hypothetical protein
MTPKRENKASHFLTQQGSTKFEFPTHAELYLVLSQLPTPTSFKCMHTHALIPQPPSQSL